MAKGGKDLRRRRCVRSEWIAFESTGSRVKGPVESGTFFIAPSEGGVIWGRESLADPGPGREIAAGGTGARSGEM